MAKKTPTHFVDCHCHLFNIEDIPLYPTINGKIPSLPRGLLALGMLFVKHPKKLLKEYRAFIDFFDKRRRDSTGWLAEGVRDAMHALPTGIPRERIITPLVMDFDKIDDSHECVSTQMQSLRREIGTIPDVLARTGVKVLPFIGVDLRKFAKKDVLEVFDKLVSDSRCGDGDVVIRSAADRQSPAILNSGDVIGVKLYPPIGFNPYALKPKSGIDPKYETFYKLCIERDIPITTHCQGHGGSYYAHDVKNNKEADGYTHATNWEDVFAKEALQKLRINFAHFGGDTAVRDEVLPKQDPELDGPEQETFSLCSKLEKKGWMRALVRLLKKYDNTYADLAAFNFWDGRSCLALAWLLVLDENDKLAKMADVPKGKDKHKIADKLLFGSDVPMILGKNSSANGRVETYGAYVSKFVAAMDLAAQKSRGCDPINKHYTIPSADELLRKLTFRNPMRFLFGIEEQSEG